MVSPSTKRRAVRLIEEEGMGGKAAACRALGLARSAAYYLPRESVESRRLRREIVELAQAIRATATGGSRRCCGARAGRSTPSGCNAFAGRKASK